MPAYEDSFRQIEEALRFYAWCPMTDGLEPPGPNAMLVADRGTLAQAALKALEQLRDEFGALKMDTFRMLKTALRPRGLKLKRP